MSNDLAYAIFLIYQRQARDLGQQYQLHEVFVTFVGGQLSADEYERKLEHAAALRQRATSSSASPRLSALPGGRSR